RIMTWFGNAASRHKTANSKPLVPIIEAFNAESLGGQAPRQVVEHKFYEKHGQYKTKVDAAYRERHGSPSADKSHLSNHVAIAKELYEAEPQEVQEEIRKEAEVDYKKRLEEYEQLRDGGEHLQTDDTEVLNSRRRQMAPFLHRFLEMFSVATKTWITATAIGKEEGSSDNQLFTCTVNVGATPGEDPLRFHEWDPNGFKDHLKPFAQFVRACMRLSDGEYLYDTSEL
ncbi:hypothetical protein K435DRAFT_872463, partial [Dendrothele bispora CBS 962.96]